eukprot:scaffold1294_cov112-Skeletonema_marinoi.AAC.5
MCSEMLDKTLPVHGDDVENMDDLKHDRHQNNTNNNKTNLGMMTTGVRQCYFVSECHRIIETK